MIDARALRASRTTSGGCHYGVAGAQWTQAGYSGVHRCSREDICAAQLRSCPLGHRIVKPRHGKHRPAYRRAPGRRPPCVMTDDQHLRNAHRRSSH